MKAMKRTMILGFALVWVAQMMWAKPVTAPADIPTYYANANGKSGTNLYNALNTIANVGFASLGYDGAIDAYQQSDVYPTDPDHPDYVEGKAGKIWDMYGACSFALGDECGNYNDECDCYNREHSIPKSWWGGGKNDMYSDIFHLVPTDGYVNNRRSAYAFGEVQNVTYTYNGCKLGSSVSTITTDRETLLGTDATCSGTVFEPKDEYKGDFARGYLGMIAKYSNTSYAITTGNGGMIFEAFKTTSHFGLTRYGMVLLMKWHREDPVSRKEIDRNNGIQATQGNRNPFIDYPYLAEFIWGERAGQTVDMSLMMPSTDPRFVPGESNGWVGDTLPPLPPDPDAPKFGVTWSVCGEELRTDSVEENNRIITMPDIPESCSETSNVFVGWTDAPISGIMDDEPEVLYRRMADMPAVTEDVTYYAVFAQETIIEDGAVPAEEVFDFNEMGLNDKQVITSPFVQNDVTITFTGGGTSPTYYTGAIRLYAGGTMTVEANGITQINLTFGASDKSNTITPDSGTYADGEWIGTAADRVVFTIGGSNGHRRIATATVSMTGSGITVTHDRFITSCQSGTEIELLPAHMPARKILVGGQLYIVTDKGVMNLQGQRIK